MRESTTYVFFWDLRLFFHWVQHIHFPAFNCVHTLFICEQIFWWKPWVKNSWPNLVTWEPNTFVHLLHVTRVTHMFETQWDQRTSCAVWILPMLPFFQLKRKSYMCQTQGLQVESSLLCGQRALAKNIIFNCMFHNATIAIPAHWSVSISAVSSSGTLAELYVCILMVVCI